MPEWTGEVIAWVVGTGVVGLLLGLLYGRLRRSKATTTTIDAITRRERISRRELDELHRVHSATTGQLRMVEDERAELKARLAGEGPVRVGAAVPPIAASPVDDDLVGLNASLRDEIEAARVRYAELYQQNGMIMNQLDEATARADELELQRVAVTEELDTARSELSGAGSSAVRVNELEAELMELSWQLDSANERVVDLERSNLSMVGELDAARSRYAELDTRNGALTDALRRTRANLFDSQVRLAEEQLGIDDLLGEDSIAERLAAEDAATDGDITIDVRDTAASSLDG